MFAITKRLLLRPAWAPRTGRVLDKLGFRRTGIAPRDCRARGRRVDCVIFERGEEQEQTQPAMAA
ncbi:MAG: hypothetical protein LC634_06630 [Sphingomonadales bacterium]|nr:hypothetical protein [Sphingomonadales bacterium]